MEDRQGGREEPLLEELTLVPKTRLPWVIVQDLSSFVYRRPPGTTDEEKTNLPPPRSRIESTERVWAMTSQRIEIVPSEGVWVSGSRRFPPSTVEG